MIIKSDKNSVAIATVLIIILAILGTWQYQKGNRDPLPASVKSQLSYPDVYPKAGQLETGSANYQPAANSLNFKMNFEGKNYIVTEQPAPVLKNSTDYLQALGVKAIYQFDAKLGSAAVTNVYNVQKPTINKGQGPQPVTVDSLGQVGFLFNDKTMVIIRPINTSTALNQDQWKQLFDSLKISN